MLPEEQKAKEQMSIVTAVSFDGSSKNELKIAMAHTDGSVVTLTTLVAVTKAGMIYIRDHGWNKMFETSGIKAIVEMKESGNEQG